MAEMSKTTTVSSFMIPVFIGYDPKEAVCYNVASHSLIRHSTTPVSIIPLRLDLLTDYKETHADASNDFGYTRFLVPHLCGHRGWAIYLDCDVVVRSDITELWNFRDDNKDVLVVKHDYKTKSSTKYLGNKNENYPKKNWSSVMLWNCSSFPNYKLTPNFVQENSGSFLHRFSWTYEERIGELPKEWNWLPDEYGENNQAKLVHYTLGAPCFNPDVPMAGVWVQELEITTGSFNK